MSPQVQIIGASNFSDDGGTTDLPEAAWLRFTHLVHMPDVPEITTNMRSKLAQATLISQPTLVKLPKAEAFPRLKWCHRQMDAVAAMYEDDSLSDDNLATVCRGRVGQAGDALAMALRTEKNKTTSLFPAAVGDATFPEFVKLEMQGKTNEVVLYLLNHTDTFNVARYFSFYASPEATLQAEISKFTYLFNELPLDAGQIVDGKYVARDKSLHYKGKDKVPPRNHTEMLEFTMPVMDGKVIPVPWQMIAKFQERIIFPKEAEIRAEEEAKKNGKK